MLRAMVMVVNPKKKERTIKCDQCDLTKDPSTITSVFSLEHTDGK